MCADVSAYEQSCVLCVSLHVCVHVSVHVCEVGCGSILPMPLCVFFSLSLSLSLSLSPAIQHAKFPLLIEAAQIESFITVNLLSYAGGMNLCEPLDTQAPEYSSTTSTSSSLPSTSPHQPPFSSQPSIHLPQLQLHLSPHPHLHPGHPTFTSYHSKARGTPQAWLHNNDIKRILINNQCGQYGIKLLFFSQCLKLLFEIFYKIQLMDAMFLDDVLIFFLFSEEICPLLNSPPFSTQ